MSNKNHSGDSAQLSLFDILGLAGNIDSKYSSDEIEEVIGKLRAAKRTAEKHEENERRRREKEELERKAREEKEKKEAHIREVTCMDLPLDWENAFNQDVRTQGIHADSISDGLIFSLSNLGRVDIEYISSITDEVVCKTNSSGKKRVINRSETILAIEKQNKMIKMFQKWIWEDERRKERLEMIFENNFSCVRKRIFDGSFLRFPEIVPCIKAHF